LTCVIVDFYTNCVLKDIELEVSRSLDLLLDIFVVRCRWFTHFYAAGCVVNSIMFLLIIFSYITSSALPLVIETLVDLLNIGLKQHVVNTGKLFSCH